ncbi:MULTISPECIES: DUF1513 domain-containing protein [Roseobacteraceae]|nr:MULTISPECIES: DUF1513 domain-containing protein [Roseobacteraceae]MBT3141239.1 DUF1513 domain-containing protein [Falsiruegeria litorea]MBT8170762.1 DUF1513 domain-containing protein [Falsiruegeria litorea]
MTSRRGFMAGLVAAGACPRLSWADAGSPAFLSAGRAPNGHYAVFGLGRDGQPIFEIPLPARGHAAAAHPHRPQAVAFARRPGRFVIVLDCVTGREVARLEAPEGRHFYGHGAFSKQGDTLFTTENDYEAGQGCLGVWDVTNGYARVGEFSSGGVGPHDVRLMPDGQTLVVANGGIETHPESGRAKLNLPTMLPNLTYLSLQGEVQEQVTLSADERLNSIRHLDVRSDGLVAFAMQWQGDLSAARPVLGVHQRGQGPELMSMTHAEALTMKGYGGSVVFWAKGQRLAVSSPRGNRVQLFDVAGRHVDGKLELEDVCGLGVLSDALIASAGTGEVFQVRQQATRLWQSGVAWDNHLVAVNRGA